MVHVGRFHQIRTLEPIGLAGVREAPRTIMRVVIVANPVSGRGRARRHSEALAAMLASKGYVADEVASEPGDARVWLPSHLVDADAVAVVGGDGTVRSMAMAVAEADVPLVHVPQGNENLFARSLGMGARLEQTVGLIETGRCSEVDIAQAGGEAMLLMASVGFDAEIVADVAARRRERVSNWHYVRSGLRQLRRWSPSRMSVQVDGAAVVSAQRGWVVVSNAPLYGGRLDPAPMARMDDGVLDLAFFPAASRLAMLGWLARCRLGRQVGAPTYVHRRVYQRVEIDCESPVRWQLDGDPPPDGAPVLIERLCVSLAPVRLRVLSV